MNMGYRHIYFMTILNTVIVFHSHLTCMASAVPSSLISNLSWGDMDDFLKFMKNYETHSRIISQPRSKTWNQILETPMTMDPEFSSIEEIRGYLTNNDHNSKSNVLEYSNQIRAEDLRKLFGVPHYFIKQHKTKRSFKQRRSSEENDSSESKSPSEPSIQKVLQLPDTTALPAAFNKIINGLGSKSQSFNGPLAETNLDFPYWNLLRQKWLLSAQPRRLSQVRLFKKSPNQNESPLKNVGTNLKRLQTGGLRIQRGIPSKRSFLYLFKLLEPDDAMQEGKYAQFPYDDPELENRVLPYPKCYLNNVSCW